MAAIELAQVWVPLMPEASRLAQGVNKIAGDAEKRFGRAGSVMGAAIAKGVDTSGRKIVDTLKSVERNTIAVEKANKANADALGRVEVAQKRLAQVTANAKSTDVQRASAAEAYKRAQRQQELTTNNLTRATKDLTAAEKAHADAQRRFSRGTGSVMPLGGQLVEQSGQYGEAAGRRWSSGFATALKTGAALVAGGGFLAGVKKVVDLGVGMESNLNRLQGVTEATAQEMERARKVAVDLGQDTTIVGASAADAAAAMLELAKGGLTMQQALAAAPGTLRLAAAAQIDAATAAESQATILNSFQLGADEANHVADALANVANAAQGEVPDFMLGMQQASAVAHGFGISMDETVSVLGLFAKAGIRGSDAGTSLKTMLTHLANPSDSAAGSMAELGLQIRDANGEFVGMRELFRQIGEASERMRPDEFQQNVANLFGTDAIRGAMIAGNQGIDTLDAMSEAVLKAGGANRMAAANMQGVPGVIEKIKNSADGAKLALYDMIKPGLESGGNQLVELLNDASDAVDKFRTGGGGLQAFSQGWRDISGAAKDLAPSVTGVVKALAGGVGATILGGWSALGATLRLLEPPLELIANLLSNKAIGAGLVATLAALYLKAKLLPPVLGAVNKTTSGWSKAMSELRGPLRNVVDESTGLVKQVGLLSQANEGSLGVLGRMRVSYLEGAQQAAEFGRSQKLTTDFARDLRTQMVNQLGPIDRFKTSISNSVDRLRSMQTVMGGMRAAGAGMSSAASGLMGALGGPWGLAITGATVAIGALGAAHAAAAQKAEEQRQKELDLQATLDETTGKITQATREKVARQLQSEDEYGTTDTGRASSYGIDKGLLIDAATGTGNKDAYEIIRRAALERGVMPGLQAINEVGAGGEQINWESIQKQLQSVGVTSDELNNALLKQGTAWDDVTKKLQNLTPGADGVRLSLQDLIDWMPTSNESIITLTQNLNELRDTFDDGAASTQERTEMLNGQWQASEALKQKYAELGAQIVAVPTKTELTVQVDESKYVDLKAKLEEAGNTVTRLPGVEGGPAVMKVEANTDVAKSELEGLLTQIKAAKPEMDVAVKFKTPDGQVIDPSQFRTPTRMPAFPGDTTVPRGGRAKGGRVDPAGRIWGPGSGTSDSILAQILGGGSIAVSNGESINTEWSTRANWPVIDAMNKGANLAPWFRRLPGYSEGGIIGLENAVSELSGAPYVRGGHSPAGVDCSGAASYLVNAALGQPQSERMATGNAAEWLADRGFITGSGPSGTLRIGWKNGGPGGGHMAVTLPDGRNAESGGSVGDFTVGGGAAGADDPQFTNQAYLPMDALYPDGWPSGGGGYGSMGYGYGGGGGGGYGGGSGGGPTGAEQRTLREAAQKVEDTAKAVEKAQKALDELPSDAKESTRTNAQDRLTKAQREHQDALDDEAAKQEEINQKVSDRNSRGGGTGNGLDGKSFGQQMFAGVLEGLGFDGELFSDPTQWGIWKLFTGGANYVGGLLKNVLGGPTQGRGQGWPPGDPQRFRHGLGGSPGPGNDGGLGGMDFADPGSAIGDTLGSLLPQVGDFLPNSTTGGGNTYTTNQNSNNTDTTGAVFNGPVTINDPQKLVRPSGRTDSLNYTARALK